MPFAPPDPPPPDYYILDENGDPLRVSRFLFDHTRVSILDLDHIVGNMDVIPSFLGCRDVKFLTQLCARGQGRELKPPSRFSTTRAAALARHGSSVAYCLELAKKSATNGWRRFRLNFLPCTGVPTKPAVFPGRFFGG